MLVQCRIQKKIWRALNNSLDMTRRACLRLASKLIMTVRDTTAAAGNEALKRRLVA